MKSGKWKLGICFMFVLATNVFCAQWYAKKGYEKCMFTENGFLVCREDYVNDFCYGKERMWSGYARKKPWYDSDKNQEKAWFDKKLIAVRNLNYKCEYHGWTKYRLPDGKWAWKCYLNSREMKDDDCKGFTKR
jgi:hypothetical protein